MSHSPLLQIVRDSIEEVFQATHTIDKASLLLEYPLLEQKIPTTVNLYLEDELRGSSLSHGELPLLEEIINGAKKAAFEDENFSPLKVSEYLSCEIELILQTEDGLMSNREAVDFQ